MMLIDVTRSGYGNSYYATGALAASHSWSALLANAADLGEYVSLDKGPLPDWLMGLSGRVFGFGSFSVMVPDALYGVATVVVLHDAVRRALGREIAIVAALFMALTPVAVLVARYNAPDALLLLLLVCAAWSLTVAAQSRRLRELLLCAVLVGLAFNTKMLEAYLPVPAFALALLLSRPRPLRRRLGELALAGALALLVSLAWFAGMMLVPAGERPYVGDSTGNSWFQLILEGNGIQRVTGNAGAFTRNLDGNLLYLFGSHVAGQIVWLLPLAVVGLALGLLVTRGSRRESFAFGAYAMWGTWTLVGCVVLSVSAGARHAYYTSILAPGVATLAAAALVTLWRSSRASRVAAVGLAIAVAGSAAIGFVLLGDSPEFLPWLRWVVLACGAAAATAILAPHLREALRGRATTTLAAAGAAVAVLAGPASYSVATVTREHTGYSPTAGPAIGAGRPAGAHVAESTAMLGFAQSLSSLTGYLLAHRDHAHFLVAATDAKTADPIALATGQPVITVGGYTGADPAPTAVQLERLVNAGQLRYVLLDATRVMPATPAARAGSAAAWVDRHCSRVPDAGIAAPGVGGPARLGAQIAPQLTLYACGPSP